VQSFILTEVSACGLQIVVTSSTFLKRKDMLKERTAVSPDHQNLQPSIYIENVLCTPIQSTCILRFIINLDSPALQVSVLHLGSHQVPK